MERESDIRRLAGGNRRPAHEFGKRGRRQGHEKRGDRKGGGRVHGRMCRCCANENVDARADRDAEAVERGVSE